MTTKHLACAFVAAVLLATLSAPALAQDASAASGSASAPEASSSAAPAAAAPTQAPVDTYKSVMSQGFEIKAVTLIPGDQQDLLLGKTGNLPAMMVVLQKQQQTAVCLFSASGWENLQIAALETATNCSVD